jgi:phage baseplate assembly protein W
MALYKGYSSFEFQRTKSFSLTDVSLVKMDILNHIFTSRGERVMMPNYGSIIPDLTFEPLDQGTLTALQEDLQTIFDFDPRVETLSFNVVPYFDDNRVEVHVKLLFIEFNIVDNMDLNITFEGSS